MKILILAEYYDPFIMGGGEISLKQSVDGLINKGHSVYVLTPNCGSNESTIIKTGNLTIHRYKSIKHKTYKPKSKEASADVYNKSKAIFYLILSQVGKIFTWEMVREAYKVLKDNDFDLIHSNNIESMLALSKIKVHLPKVAHVRDLATISLNYRTHNNKYNSNTSVNIIKKYFNTNNLIAKLIIWDIVKRRKKAFDSIDYIIAINEYVKQEIIKEIPEKEKQIKVLYNSMDNIKSELTKEQAKKKLNITKKFNVLFVGSLTDIKGANFIVDTAYYLPDINFIVIGNGPYKEDIEDSGLDNIDYRGTVNNVNDYYKACDILFLPQTVHYGIGRVAIEALSNGIPIVSTNIKGIDEFIIEDKTGVLVKEWTSKHFAVAIKELKNYRAMRDHMSKESVKLIGDKFNKKTMINKLEELYKGFLK